MSTWAITGKMGTGKSKLAVRRMRQALCEGRKVATNIDLDIGKLIRPTSKSTYVRLPDKPTADDLEGIGKGNDSYDEDRNGLLVLDEMATWLNARSFQDRERQPTINWLVHARKKGWDVVFIMQNVNQVDKQVRESLIEFVTRCARLDKVKIPVFGALMQIATLGLWTPRLPKMHIATTRLGPAPDALIADREMYFGDDVHKAYDTRQVFTDDYPCGTHSVLSPWHLMRTQGAPAKRSWWDWMTHGAQHRAAARPARKPKHRVVGLIQQLPPEQRLSHWKRLQALGAF